MNISEELVKAIVKKVMTEGFQSSDTPFQKEIDASGIVHVQTDTVQCEPFGDDPRVKLKDLLSLEEAPRIGAGIMELDHTRFEWTLNYDEFDMVIDGVLEIEIDGRTVRGSAGDIIYIPKGSHIYFKTPETTRYAYFVYPADWQEQA